MLHKRELPDSEFEDLNKVYQVKLKLMYWLLRTPPVGQVTKEDIETLFGKKSKLLGWFGARRLGKPDKRTQFGQALDALANKARSEPIEANQVAGAIEHDAVFHQNWH